MLWYYVSFTIQNYVSLYVNIFSVFNREQKGIFFPYILSWYHDNLIKHSTICHKVNFSENWMLTDFSVSNPYKLKWSLKQSFWLY